MEAGREGETLTITPDTRPCSQGERQYYNDVSILSVHFCLKFVLFILSLI